MFTTYIWGLKEKEANFGEWNKKHSSEAECSKRRGEGNHSWKRVSLSRDREREVAKSAKDTASRLVVLTSDARWNAPRKTGTARAGSWKACFLCLSQENSVLWIKSKFSRTYFLSRGLPWSALVLKKKERKRKKISVMTSVVWEAKLETVITGDCHSSQARMIRRWHTVHCF